MFEEMTYEKIHQIDDRNAELNHKICGFFLENIDDDEIVFHIFHESKLGKNPFATYEIALWYRDGVFLNQSDEKYKEFLRKTLLQIKEKAAIISRTENDLIIKESGAVIEKTNNYAIQGYNGLIMRIMHNIGLYLYSMYEPDLKQNAFAMISGDFNQDEVGDSVINTHMVDCILRVMAYADGLRNRRLEN